MEENKENENLSQEQAGEQKESKLKKLGGIKTVLAAIAAISAIFIKTKGDENKKTKPLNVKFITILVLAVSIVVLYSGYTNGRFSSTLSKFGYDSPVPIKAEEIQKLIDENLLQEGMTSTVSDIKEEYGMYKFKLDVQGQQYESYITKDRKILFPSAVKFEEIQKEKADAEKQAAQEKEDQKKNLTKTSKPQVELFVMSHCPYGTQVEKGILPVVELLGDKVDFDVKFCDYAMHGEKELQEQMQQYCISQSEPSKYLSYLTCFLDAGDSTACLKTANIDQTKLKSCISTTDKTYKVMSGFKDESTWKNGTYPLFTVFQADVDKYKVQGSPTLVVNGQTVKADRDPQSMLEIVCAGFENAPSECQEKLSSTVPTSGFGYEGSDQGSGEEGCAG